MRKRSKSPKHLREREKVEALMLKVLKVAFELL